MEQYEFKINPKNKVNIKLTSSSNENQFFILNDLILDDFKYFRNLYSKKKLSKNPLLLTFYRGKAKVKYKIYKFKYSFIGQGSKEKLKSIKLVVKNNKNDDYGTLDLTIERSFTILEKLKNKINNKTKKITDKIKQKQINDKNEVDNFISINKQTN